MRHPKRKRRTRGRFNPMAKALNSPLYKQRRVKSKKRYSRKGRHAPIRDQEQA